MTIQSGAPSRQSGFVDFDQLAALMAFPQDEDARRAFALYMSCDRAARLGQSIQLTADDYFLITSSGLTRPEIYQRAESAHKRGMNAAILFVWMSQQATDSKPSLAKAYRAVEEYKQQVYSEFRQTLKEKFPASDSNRVDRKYFEGLRPEFESVLHFWMAAAVVYNKTGHGPDVADQNQYLAFLAEAERCAEYLGSISFDNRHAPPVDTSKLIRIPVSG